MSKSEVVIRFDRVTFKYNEKKLVLDEVDFSVRRNSKITIIGQNGAGKSTIFKLLTGELKPQSGRINIDLGARIGIAEQMLAKDKLDLTVQEYFAVSPKKMLDSLQAVDLQVPLDKLLRDLSGGQKARLLLASALIQDPDVLLLDEPTNNLDQAGIEHLTRFLINYPKTCIVISHDANFLNAFTDGILNLDVHTHKVEQFVGNYYDALAQIEAHIERQRLLNARLEKSIKDRFEKVNKLGGKSVAMRRLAVKVREDIEEDREKMVDVRREDKTLPSFTIPYQHHPRALMQINEISFLKDGEVMTKPVDIELRRGMRLLISGPNGIGKSTLLKALQAGKGAVIDEGVRVGYYSQDFSELDFEQSAFDSLRSVALPDKTSKDIFATAARFLLSGELLQNKVGSLSEGQKGLLCYARFVLQEPGLLIMDEPTNHINFRHIPVIAEALNEYKGALILVSHLPEFVWQMRMDDELDLAKYAGR